MSETIFVPEIKVAGTKLEILDPDASLAELRVSRSSGSAASAQLWIDMTDSDVDSIQIGSTLEINVLSLDGPQSGGPIFEGSVTSIGIEVEARGRNGLSGRMTRRLRLVARRCLPRA